MYLANTIMLFVYITLFKVVLFFLRYVPYFSCFVILFYLLSMFSFHFYYFQNLSTFYDLLQMSPFSEVSSVLTNEIDPHGNFTAL